MATLKDVAELACVDVSTVSRALNNTSYVHPDTKERIYAAAKELGYHPNMMARALRQGRRHTIGVVVPRLHLTIFSQILQGIEQGASKLGYATLICNTEDDPKTERDCLTKLRNGFVDGIIVAGTGRNGRLIRDIKASGIAVVQIVRQQEASISSVLADYEACGFDAVNFLYNRGCRKIGLINGSLQLIPYKGRHDGYRKAVKTLGLEEQQERRLKELAPAVRNMEQLAAQFSDDPERILPEPGPLESAKSYREKKAKPLLAQIVKVLRSLYRAYVELKGKYERLLGDYGRAREGNERLSDHLQEVKLENKALRGTVADFERVKRAFGPEEVERAVEDARRREVAEKEQKKAKRKFSRGAR